MGVGVSTCAPTERILYLIGSNWNGAYLTRGRIMALIDVAGDVLYDVARDRLNTQLQSVDQLDAKGATIYSFASAVLGFFAALLSLSASPKTSPADLLFFGALVFAGLVYIVLIVCVLRAYQVSAKWSFRPDLQTLQSNCATYSSSQMQLWVGRECVHSYVENESLIAQKARHLHTALLLLPAEAILLTCAAVVSMATR